MKEVYITTALLALFAIGSASSAMGQDAKLTSDEVGQITGRAVRKLDRISFRVVLITEWFTERNGTVFNKNTETFATVLPDNYQIISESAGTRTETLVVRGKTFRRTNEDDWESVANSPVTKAGSEAAVLRFGDLEGGAFLHSGIGKFIAKGTIDGQEVAMYEVRTNRANQTKDAMARTETTQYWIDNDGHLVRKVIEQDVAGDKRFMRSVANYNYDGIRIDEPILPIKPEDK